METVPRSAHVRKGALSIYGATVAGICRSRSLSSLEAAELTGMTVGEWRQSLTAPAPSFDAWWRQTQVLGIDPYVSWMADHAGEEMTVGDIWPAGVSR